MELVSFETMGAAGVITLMRPEKLNALTADMIQRLHEGLDRFAHDEAVQCIVLRSSSARAFCAGGDIRAVRDWVLEGKTELAEAFFAREFALNLKIAECAKPVVSLIDGLCLGGGCGLSMHGAYRVVTPAARIGMPETAIGYFPDVGASYFLSRLDGGVGLYLGLTGAQIGAEAALAAGLATHLAPPNDFVAIVEQLAAGRPIAAILAPYATRGRWAEGQDRTIKRVFEGAESLAQIRQRLEAEPQDGFAATILMQLEAASPSSLELAFSMQKQAVGRSLAAVLELELAAAQQRIRHADFLEGIRARLVDRDQPQWLGR